MIEADTASIDMRLLLSSLVCYIQISDPDKSRWDLRPG